MAHKMAQKSRTKPQKCATKIRYRMSLPYLEGAALAQLAHLAHKIR